MWGTINVIALKGVEVLNGKNTVCFNAITHHTKLTWAEKIVTEKQAVFGI